MILKATRSHLTVFPPVKSAAVPRPDPFAPREARPAPARPSAAPRPVGIVNANMAQITSEATAEIPDGSGWEDFTVSYDHEMKCLLTADRKFLKAEWVPQSVHRISSHPLAGR